MNSHPVRYSVAHPNQFAPVQLFARIAAFVALGMLGLSFGSIFAVAYIALPAYAASRLASTASPAKYLHEDGPRVTRLLYWLASVSAWVGLVSDQLPSARPDETVSLVIEDAQPRPSPAAALWRIITGLPSAFVLMLLCAVGVFVWMWAALSILFTGRIGSGAFDYLVGLQRWSVRLLAYQACLVDDYPPFSFADLPLPATRVGA